MALRMLVSGPETVETMAALASGAMGKDVFVAWLRRYVRNEYFIYFRYLTRFYHEYDTRSASLPSMIRPTADLLQGASNRPNMVTITPFCTASTPCWLTDTEYSLPQKSVRFLPGWHSCATCPSPSHFSVLHSQQKMKFLVSAFPIMASFGKAGAQLHIIG